MKEITYSALIRLAAEMAKCVGMPSEYREDYPAISWRHVREKANIANEMSRDWAYRLRRIINEEEK